MAVQRAHRARANNLGGEHGGGLAGLVAAKQEQEAEAAARGGSPGSSAGPSPTHAAGGSFAGLAAAAVAHERDHSPRHDSHGSTPRQQPPSPSAVQVKYAPEGAGAAGEEEGTLGKRLWRKLWVGTKEGIVGRADPDAKKHEARREINEMVNYLLFLSLFLITTLADRSNPHVFRMGDSIRVQMTQIEFMPSHAHVPKTFVDVATVEEFYQYLEGPFYTVLYAAGTWDGDNEFPADFGRGNFLGPNEIVAGVRVGTVRVKQEGCPDIPDQLKLDGGWRCYPKFSSDLLETAPYGLGDEQYTYEEVDEPWFSTRYGATSTTRYPGPGYAVTLPRAESEDCDFATGANCTVRDIVYSFRQNKLVDMQTRAVFIDVNFYNAMLDTFSLTRLFVEATEAGGLDSDYEILTQRLFLYHATGDYVRAVLEILVMLFVLQQLTIEISHMRRLRLKYFKSLVNIPHFINLMLFFLVFGFRLAATLELPDEIDVNSSSYLNLRTPAVYFRVAQDYNSFNAFLCWLKVFRYLSFIPKFAQLTRTLGKAAGSISGFGVIFSIVLFGSSQAFMLAFGTQLYEFHSVGQAFYALLRALLGDFELNELVHANKFLAPLFFIAFILLVVFVLLNMFIAIISDAYVDTKDELKLEEDMDLDTLGKEIYLHVLEKVFKIPIIGRIVERIYKTAEEAALATTKALVDGADQLANATQHAGAEGFGLLRSTVVSSPGQQSAWARMRGRPSAAVVLPINEREASTAELEARRKSVEVELARRRSVQSSPSSPDAPDAPDEPPSASGAVAVPEPAIAAAATTTVGKSPDGEGVIAVQRADDGAVMAVETRQQQIVAGNAAPSGDHVVVNAARLNDGTVVMQSDAVVGVDHERFDRLEATINERMRDLEQLMSSLQLMLAANGGDPLSSS